VLLARAPARRRQRAVRRLDRERHHGVVGARLRHARVAGRRRDHVDLDLLRHRGGGRQQQREREASEERRQLCGGRARRAGGAGGRGGRARRAGGRGGRAPALQKKGERRCVASLSLLSTSVGRKAEGAPCRAGPWAPSEQIWRE
jgi:hypothetical protein